MRHCQHGSALGDFLKRSRELRLGFRIKRRSCFIENENRRILEERTRNRETLLLPAREQTARLAHSGIEPLRQTLHELIESRSLKRFPDLSIRLVGEAVGDVLADGCIQEDGVLRHHGDLVSE